MNPCLLIGASLLSIFIGIVFALPATDQEQASGKILDLTHSPVVPRTTGHGSGLNISFFVPAFSLFALASQMLPSMFPTLTTTTTSKSSRMRRETDGEAPDWLETAITNGLLY